MHATYGCTAWSLQLCQALMLMMMRVAVSAHTRSNACRVVAEGTSTVGQYVTGTL